MKRFYASTNHRLVARSISNQEARQRLIRRLRKQKKPVEEEMPNISSEQAYVISKPWKEAQVVQQWVVDENSDPLFNVSNFIHHYLISIANHSLGVHLESQKAYSIQSACSR